MITSWDRAGFGVGKGFNVSSITALELVFVSGVDVGFAVAVGFGVGVGVGV